MGRALPLMVGIALITFFWGLVRYLFSAAGNEKSHEEGRNIMIWGTLALFVMVSVWGLVHFIQRSFGLTDFGL